MSLEEQVNNSERNQELKDYELIARDIPVIISAPHSAKQFRNGQIQAKEVYTDTLVKNVSEKEGISCIYKTQFLNDDVNVDTDSKYKQELKEFIQSHNVKYLLDIHTMNKKRLPEVCIAINAGKNINNNYTLLNEIISVFNRNSIDPVTVDEPFKAANPNCISNYIATNCNIPCFHIEINKKYASIANNTFSKVPLNKQNIEKSLCEVIKVLKNNL